MQASSKALCIGLLGLLALTTVSCGADETTQTTDAVNQSQSAATTDFNATLVGGGDVDIQVALQQSPIALWFWAPG